jgi:hypothetical protein
MNSDIKKYANKETEGWKIRPGPLMIMWRHSNLMFIIKK